MAGIPSRLHGVGIRQFPRRKEGPFCWLEVKGWMQAAKDNSVHSRLTSGISWANEKELVDSQKAQWASRWAKRKASVSTHWAPPPPPVVILTHGPALVAD